ncbi:alpha/beta fold hydrolase [Streptomyces shenzhenensis]|uniref:alpha/beta fold hydrolase n=1 Tax=Streptomyces shenzhenensis TaxID=943815 RepID=UPI0015F0394F|nr:alpha/beta hydrolase [Streptomyces shenzhenensis]
MPHVLSNGIRLAYQRSGHGESVLLIMGSAAAGRVWTMHQTPALVRAGYETITFDNRGIPPSDAPPGRYSLADMVADTHGLIKELGLGPCRVIGTSLGAMIAQELAIASPDSVRCAVLLGTRARADAFRRAHTLADRALAESGHRPPAAHKAVMSVLQMLSPRTLDDDNAVASWLDLFELSAGDRTAAGQAWADIVDDRRMELRKISAPCRVIAFADDVITPPHLCAEVAEAIPDCDLVEIPECGHLGYLERPGEVNSAILEFLDKN